MGAGGWGVGQGGKGGRVGKKEQEIGWGHFDTFRQTIWVVPLKTKLMTDVISSLMIYECKEQ